MTPDKCTGAGLDATVCFPLGNLAPEGSVIKSTSIDPSLIDAANVYKHRGPARVFITETAAMEAIKNGSIGQGDVIVLICGGPRGAGMQETYQVTGALKQLASLQTRRRTHGRALQRRFHGGMHRPHIA
jgi:dihydroxyacid dehydratase/phosphogluconate dehydratase